MAAEGFGLRRSHQTQEVDTIVMAGRGALQSNSLNGVKEGRPLPDDSGTVFISYTHDSPEHADKVLGFIEKTPH